MAKRAAASNRISDSELLVAAQRLGISFSDLKRPKIRKLLEEHLRAVRAIVEAPIPYSLPKEPPGSIGVCRVAANSRAGSSTQRKPVTAAKPGAITQTRFSTAKTRPKG